MSDDPVVDEVERGVLEVLRASAAMRKMMLAGNEAGAKEGMDALARFFESIPAAYTAGMAFILACRAMHGDALTWEGK